MITPYYQDEFVTLYHGNCLAISGWTAADVLVTDPPYGIGYASGARRVSLPASIVGDEDTTLRDQVLAALGPSTSALVFGSWRRPRPAGTRQVLIWDTKGALGMGDLSLPWKPSHQEIYVIGNRFSGRRDSDVITCPPVQSLGYNGRSHPHEKPVALMARLIDKCELPPGGLIADPFAGVGSTLIAAKAARCRAMGVEIEERYCEIAANRLAQGVLNFGGAA